MTDEHAHPLGDALAAAVRAHQPSGTDGEREALAAFRAARDTGALAAAPRPSDDWRPRRGRSRWSARAAVGAVLASLTVGGVAVAGIGSVATTDEPRERSRPASTVAPVLPAPSATPAPRTSAAAVPERDAFSASPEQTRDQRARCKAYENGHGLNRSERATEGCATPTATPVHGKAADRGTSGAAADRTPPGVGHGRGKNDKGGKGEEK
ncbi:hypothetical protein ABII15_23970 [Streptomyces sp. HUAS MG91]|uniref:Uncharacterized protein n=1 Tax=Streptomyces tabacisoli TaxID=3156398 RepID=A0AAU8IX01_9ACTN